MQFEIFTEGWLSTHRSADAFDVSIPAPDVDAPLVVRAFLVPPEATVKEALAAITQRAAQAGATIERNGDFVVHGGDGPLIESRDGGIALDAAPDGYVRVGTQDTEGGPLLYVWWVPDEANEQLVDDPDHSVASTVQVTENAPPDEPAGRPFAEGDQIRRRPRTGPSRTGRWLARWRPRR